MMHPSYKAWKDACNAMMCQKRRLKYYFQWYPFSVLSMTDWEILSSEAFFSTYIQDGAFLICYSMRFTTKRLCPKAGDCVPRFGFSFSRPFSLSARLRNRIPERLH